VTQTTAFYVKLFRDFACQKLSKSANVLRSYSQIKFHSFFRDTV